MKKFFLFSAALCCLFLSGCIGVGISNIGLKILEKQVEIDAAVMSEAMAFYQDEKFEYIETPVRTFREFYPGASLIVSDVHPRDNNVYVPLGPMHPKNVFLSRKKDGREHWNYWEVAEKLPENVEIMKKPEEWFNNISSEKYFMRYQLVDVAERDNNSVWRKTGAITCMVLLDFPLTVLYSCSGLILGIPAALYY